MSDTRVCISCLAEKPVVEFPRPFTCKPCVRAESNQSTEQRLKTKMKEQVQLNRIINAIPVSMYPK